MSILNWISVIYRNTWLTWLIWRNMQMRNMDCIWWVTLSERSCPEWFHVFENGNVADAERKGRMKVYEDAQLEALLEDHLYQTQKELALALKVTKWTISHRLKVGKDTKAFFASYIDWWCIIGELRYPKEEEIMRTTWPSCNIHSQAKY